MLARFIQVEVNVDDLIEELKEKGYRYNISVGEFYNDFFKDTFLEFQQTLEKYCGLVFINEYRKTVYGDILVYTDVFNGSLNLGNRLERVFYEGVSKDE